MDGFRTAQVTKLTGVHGKTLHYWDTSGFISPSVAESHGTGTRRRYSFQDLVALRVAREMRQAGVPLQALRHVVKFLRERKGFAHPMAEAFLATDGKQVYLKDGDDLIAILREPGQKMLFQVVDLSKAVNELYDATAKLTQDADTADQESTDGPRRAV